MITKKPYLIGMKRPNALNYLATWEYIADYDIWAQKSRSGYSQRNFAKWAQVKSPNFISLLISKKRSLKGEWLNKFILASRMSSLEELHFRRLSAFENAKSSFEREKIFSEIKSSLDQDGLTNLATDQLEILTTPNAWTLYHMLDLSDQESTSIWFKKRLRFLKMNSVEIDEAFKMLERLDLVKREAGTMRSQQKKLVSPDQIKSQSNVVYHKFILNEAGLALDVLLPAERSFGSLTATVSREKVDDLKKEINKFGQYLMSKYASKESVDGEVFRLNIQLYPLTQKRKQEKK